MAELALGTVRALLDLTRKEAQLLAGVRGDVQFIRDEMESMNGLLRLLEGTEERASDHQVRAWMKQVMELAYDSSKCVERYAQSGRARPGDKGLLGRLRRVFRLPRALVVRRRVAVRIRQLKVRAREIGERQQRYGVAVPPKKEEADVANKKLAGRGGPGWHPHAESRDAFRRAVLAGPDILTQSTGELIGWLKEEPRAEERQWPRVIAIFSQDGGGATLARQVYEQSCGAKLFELTACVTIRRPPYRFEVQLDLLRELVPEDHIKSIEEIPPSVKGKKMLIVLPSLEYTDEWTLIKEVLDSFECSAGSAVVFSTKDRNVADGCSPFRTMIYSLVDFHLKKAVSLALDTYNADTDSLRQFIIRKIINRYKHHDNYMSMFLQSLYHNPSRAEEELKRLSEDLDPQELMAKKNQMITFCYDGLPERYKNCLWYSTVFAQGSYQVRRASLVRRWVAEGLIAKVGRLSALDEAERCFDALLNQKLLLPSGVGPVGGASKVKSCAVDASVSAMIKDTADEDFLDTNQLPPDLALHFSIRNGIHLRQSRRMMMKFLKSLPTSSRLRLLRVLDLQGYQGLNKRHLKNICKIHELKYLSLRNTGVAQLPKQIEKLASLETLDIRQTKVKALDAFLPMLKHLLAGRIDCTGEDTVKSKESFSTMCVPRDVAQMKKLEILSRVKVIDCSKELKNTGDKLDQLRKLGVVLCGKKASLKDLFYEIDKLHRCLRSLSIRMEPPGNSDQNDAILLTPPKHLESLNICGIRSGLPHRIKELHQLAKVTLRDTLLKADALTILGLLNGLRCLRLRYHSFAEGALTFGNGQFSNLTDLVIEDDIVMNIAFASGTAPKLNKMVWSFTRMESLSGVQNLPSLRQLELNRGRSNVPGGLEELRRDIKAHGKVAFKLNVPEAGRGSGDAGAAS